MQSWPGGSSSDTAPSPRSTGSTSTVPQGTVLGLLGPNGAGKTTAVRDPDHAARRRTPARPRSPASTCCASPTRCAQVIGLSGQYAAVDEYLTGYENLDMVGRLYHLGRAPARVRARELLERFDLATPATGRSRPTPAACGAGSTSPARWSPTRQVLFLDEPTTGLDPRSRNDMWDVIAELVAAGTTLLLTTQYLEEADRLADRIVVIDHGKVDRRGHRRRAQDPGRRRAPRARRRRRGPARRGPRAARLSSATARSRSTPTPAALIGAGHRRRAARWSRRCAGSTPARSRSTTSALRRPTLDDVFLTLTGHARPRTSRSDGAAGQGPAEPQGSATHERPDRPAPTARSSPSAT